MVAPRFLAPVTGSFKWRCRICIPEAMPAPFVLTGHHKFVQ
jgi:hypothetical protein